MVEGADVGLTTGGVADLVDVSAEVTERPPEGDSAAWAAAEERLSQLTPDWTVKSRAQAIYDDIMNSHSFIVQEFTPPPPDVAKGGFDLRAFLTFAGVALVVLVVLVTAIKALTKKSALGKAAGQLSQALEKAHPRTKEEE